MRKEVEFYKPNLKHSVKKNINYFKRYCCVSLSCAVILLILLFIFTSIAGFYYLFSFILAYIIAMTLSFPLNRIFVFSYFNPKRLSRQYYEFFIVSFSGFIINLILLYMLVDIIGIWYLLSEILIGIFGIPLLFVIHKKIAFSHK